MTSSILGARRTRSDTDDDVSDQPEFAPFRSNGTYSANGLWEMECVTTGLYREGIGISALVKPKIATSVNAALDLLGRINGKVVFHTPKGFILSIDSEMSNDLRTQLDWINANVVHEQKRRYFRIKPHKPDSTIRLSSSRVVMPIRIVDFSICGANIESAVKLSVGDKIVFRHKTLATVARSIDESHFGVVFEHEFNASDFTFDTRL
jgi:hypothetical protein